MIQKFKKGNSYIIVRLRDEEVHKQTYVKIEVLDVTVQSIYIRFLDAFDYTERFSKFEFEQKYGIVEDLGNEQEELIKRAIFDLKNTPMTLVSTQHQDEAPIFSCDTNCFKIAINNLD